MLYYTHDEHSILHVSSERPFLRYDAVAPKKLLVRTTFEFDLLTFETNRLSSVVVLISQFPPPNLWILQDHPLSSYDGTSESWDITAAL